MGAYKECKANGHYDDDITIQGLIARDGNKCYLCNKEVEFNNDSCSPRYPNIEHIKPRSKGGTHSYDNVKVACRDCNVRKGTRYVGVFIGELNARKKQKLMDSIKGRVERAIKSNNLEINLDDDTTNVFNQHKEYKDNLDNILDGKVVVPKVIKLKSDEIFEKIGVHMKYLNEINNVSSTVIEAWAKATNMTLEKNREVGGYSLSLKEFEDIKQWATNKFNNNQTEINNTTNDVEDALHNQIEVLKQQLQVKDNQIEMLINKLS